MKNPLNFVNRERWKARLFVAAFMLPLLFTSCSAPQTATATPSPTQAYREEEVHFTFGDLAMFGILALPEGEGPFPAIVIIGGSREGTGEWEGVKSPIYINHSEQFNRAGFAVLRYDPPGVGNSEGTFGTISLDAREVEAYSAIEALKSRTDILSDHIGLWGISQGGWVIAMTAADHPEDVAFLISVSGATISIADQQVYSTSSQSRAMGMSDENVMKATLFTRALIDMSQQGHPIYEEVNRADAALLGEGPWNSLIKLVYEAEGKDPYQNLQEIIALLESVQDESWTTYLYLKEAYLPALKSATREQLLSVNDEFGESQRNDPKDFIPRVKCPVLAIWGEKDPLMPAQQMKEQYQEYLAQGGNENGTFVVVPYANHSINNFVTSYWDTVLNWLGDLYQ